VSGTFLGHDRAASALAIVQKCTCLQPGFHIQSVSALDVAIVFILRKPVTLSAMVTGHRFYAAILPVGGRVAPRRRRQIKQTEIS
jgi:hypothetical protein